MLGEADLAMEKLHYYPAPAEPLVLERDKNGITPGEHLLKESRFLFLRNENLPA